MNKISHFIFIFAMAVSGIMLTSCEKEDEKAIQELETLKTYLATEFPNAVELDEGLYMIRIQSGTGSYASVGRQAIVHYTGYLMDGTEFDSSRDDTSPFAFVVGAGYVIRAWDKTLPRMRVGDRVLMFTTSANAYGPNGSGEKIKGYSTLKFEIELLGIAK